LATFIEEHGEEVGKFTFAPIKNGSMETVSVENCPKGFAGVADSEEGDALVVAEKPDQILYQIEQGEIEVYATNAEEFIAAIRRDETWEELAENMPASKPYWLGIIVKTRNANGQLLTLGFKGETRNSAMVIRGRAETEEMIADALTRELKGALEITDYSVIDLVDDGGVVEDAGVEEPLFTVTVEVERFDPLEKIQDKRVSWIEMEGKKLVN
jgi:hypothetical protein